MRPPRKIPNPITERSGRELLAAGKTRDAFGCELSALERAVVFTSLVRARFPSDLKELLCCADGWSAAPEISDGTSKDQAR